MKHLYDIGWITKLFIKYKQKNILSILDLVVTIFSYFLAYFVANVIETDYFNFTIDYVYMLILIVPTWALLLRNSNLTSIPRTRSTLSIFFNLLNFNFVGFLLIFLYKHLFQLHIFSHYVIISFTVFNMLSLFILRMVTYRVFKYFRVNGHNINNVIIYADDKSEKFISDILTHKEWGFRILMIITDSERIRKKFGKELRIFPDKISIRELVKIDIVDEVIYCKSSINNEIGHDLIQICEEIGVIFRLESKLSPMTYSNAYLAHFNNFSFLTFNHSQKNYLALIWKNFMDFWISFAIIFLLSPFMLLIAFIIKVSFGNICVINNMHSNSKKYFL